MSKDFKVGDYVRTKGGLIGKVIKTKGNSKTYFIPSRQENDVIEIIKSSSNIIDLIEVGDYVNGDRVKALKGDIESHKINNEDDVIYTEYINDYDEWCGFEEDEIKSIVTKEQFESMEYNLGDKENE